MPGSEWSHRLLGDVSLCVQPVGDPVTRENFSEWKRKFDLELAEHTKRAKSSASGPRRLTGTHTYTCARG